MSYVLPSKAEDLINYVNTWVELKKKDGTIDKVFDHWILGKAAERKGTPLVGNSRCPPLDRMIMMTFNYLAHFPAFSDSISFTTFPIISSSTQAPTVNGPSSSSSLVASFTS